MPLKRQHMQAAGAPLHTYPPTSNKDPLNEDASSSLSLDIDSSPLKIKSEKCVARSSSHPPPSSKCTQTHAPHKDSHPDHEITMEAEWVLTYSSISKSAPIPSNVKDIPLGICSIICNCLNTSKQPWGAVKSGVDDEWNNIIWKQIAMCSWCDKVPNQPIASMSTQIHPPSPQSPLPVFPPGQVTVPLSDYLTPVPSDSTSLDTWCQGYGKLMNDWVD
ncbi:hypothetical protein GYMLUDRAFT_251849 [Collybiopsis luxurians FD-317 M1]|uniref:Uncharacterized protein n=1 Tax=Collybiopsis luxurians FD-317 M1 TaxID=944289 RepID=A0A0D0C1P7_9AGAR|nr:hypothetical protein GYMLUDRAFT_251849 [Collybiopsis luxurians FD-317 M1]